MKKLSALLLALGLVLSLTGCRTQEGPPPQSSSGPAPIPVPQELPELPPEPPVFDWMGETAVPTFLTGDQQDLYLRARVAGDFLIISPELVEQFPLADGSRLNQEGLGPHESCEMHGQTYTVSMGRYRRWDDFQTMLDSLFTPRLQEELLCPEGDVPHFAPDEDGAMCFLTGGRGGSLPYALADLPDRFELVSSTDHAIEFTLIGHYADYVYEDCTQPGEIYTEEFPIRMVNTPEGWRLDEFHIPY